MTASTLALIPDAARKKFNFWRDLIEPLLSVEKGITAAIQSAAKRAQVSPGTLREKYDLVTKGGGGCDWTVLIDRRLVGPAAWDTRDQVGISDADKSLLKTYCENSQRGNEAGIRKLLEDWRKGLVTSTASLDPRTGYPRGWSERNLKRHAPTKFELKAVRVSLSLAASERPLVYTTRAHLSVGQFYLFDDMWHDHEVNHLDQRKTGRPLEFHALDLKSACKFAWGMRVRTEGEGGKMEGLKEADMRFLLAMVLGGHGYNAETGTTLVVEHGTAAIREDMARLLFDATGGKIVVNRSGMEGASAHAGQYAGRAKGNFKFKAALESLGNLIHNEMGMLPGQTGKDRDHRPAHLHGLLKNNDALMCAVSQLPPERVAMLQWDLLTVQQFRAIAEDIYARINGRHQHDLQGWDMHYVPDHHRPGTMRRLSPAELWQPGRRALTRLAPEAVALMLWQDLAVERQTRSHMFAFNDGELSGDVLRFDATDLPDREKFATVLNPFATDFLYVFDARGRFLAAAPRIESVCRSDEQAVKRAIGQSESRKAKLLQPLRLRHLAEAREKNRRAAHNADVIGNTTPEEKSKARAIRRIGADAGDLLDAEPASLHESHHEHDASALL